MNTILSTLTASFRSIANQGLAMEFVYVALPKVCGGLGTLLINLLLVHQLGVASYGIYSLCITGILLFDAILGSAIDMGVLKLAPKYSATDQVASLALERSALLIKLVAALAFSAVLLWFSGPISQAFFQQSGAWLVIFLSCMSGIGLLLMRSVQLHLQLAKRFQQYGVLDWINHLLRLSGVAAVVVLWEPSPTKILAVWATVPFLVSIIGLALFGRKLLKPPTKLGQPTLELLRFVQWSFLTYCLTSLASRADPFLIGLLSGVEEVGIFAAGSLFTLIPELLGMYLAVLFGPRITPAMENGTIATLLAKTQKILLVVALVILLVGWIAIGTIGHSILPLDYHQSLTVVAILLPGALAAMVNFPLVNSYVMFASPRSLMKIEMVSLPLAIALYLVIIPTYGAIGAAVVSSCFRTSKAIYTLLLAWHLANSQSTSVASTSA